MADPLSIGAGAVGIIAFVQGVVVQVNSLVEFSKKIRDVCRDIGEIFGDIDLFQSMLCTVTEDMNFVLLYSSEKRISFEGPLGKALLSYG